MSLLKSLKGTFQNVQQDIVDGFRALSALDSTTRQRKVLQLEARDISVDAGADLLYKYHKHWSEMQSCSADMAVMAEEVDQMLRVLLTEWERRGQSANRLEEEVATLPTIASTLKDMQEVIESLCEDFRAVEEEIEKLQDVAEEEGLRQEQLSHHAQLAAYVKSRQAEASTVKGKLWKKLKEKSKELESQKVQSMGRGQSVVTEMDHLSPPRSHSVSEETLQPNNSSSRNVGADQFHSSQYGPVSSDEGDQGDLSAGEEAFIEDDYTLDYSTTLHHDDLFPDLDEDVPIDFDGVCGADSPAAQDLSECRDACMEDTLQSAEDSGREGVACEGVSTEDEKA